MGKVLAGRSLLAPSFLIIMAGDARAANSMERALSTGDELTYILSKLSAGDAFVAECTCKSWRDAGRGDSDTWEQRFVRDFPSAGKLVRQHLLWLSGGMVQAGPRGEYMLRYWFGISERMSQHDSWYQGYVESGDVLSTALRCPSRTCIDGDDGVSAALRSFMAVNRPGDLVVDSEETYARADAAEELRDIELTAAVDVWRGLAKGGFDDDATVRWAFEANALSSACFGQCCANRSTHVLLKEYPRLIRAVQRTRLPKCVDVVHAIRRQGRDDCESCQRFELWMDRHTQLMRRWRLGSWNLGCSRARENLVATAETQSSVCTALQSPDVLSQLMAALDVVDVAAACVCSTWRDQFDQRMRGLLRPVYPRRRFESPGADRNWSFTRPRFATHPDGERLHIMCQRTGDAAHPLDRRVSELMLLELDAGLRTVRTVSADVLPGSLGQWFQHTDDEDDQVYFVPGCYWKDLAIGQDSIYVALSHAGVCRLTLNGSEWSLSSHMLIENRMVERLALSGSLLFAVVFTGAAADGWYEIVILDATTLQPRHSFARGCVHPASSMVVSGDDLYVCGNSSILVFSLGGELRRELEGPWRRPSVLRIFEGRLYLLEATEYVQDGDSAVLREAKAKAALRTFVVTLNGDICQEYVVPRHWLSGQLNDMIVLEGRLLLSCEWGRSLLVLRLN